jgi:DNA-binding LytR/AlgR family response regulator
MKVWKLAILEDNQELLEDRKRNLQAIENVQVVASAHSSADFLKQVRETKPDAILVDIDLKNDSMNGLDIAYKLNLPVLFVSSENAKHIKDLENLKLEHDLIVDHITKPFTETAFIKTVQRFIKDIYIRNAAEFKLNENQTRQGYKYDSIVFLSADKMEGSESNNKMIYFNDQPPRKLVDFSFKTMEEKGFHPHHFLTIHRSFRVNKRHIKRYDRERFVIIVDAYSSSTGKLEEKQLPVSENFRSEVKKHLKPL